MASVLVPMSTWRHFDPLPVLGLTDGDRWQRDWQARADDQQEQEQYRSVDGVLPPSSQDPSYPRRPR